MSVKCDVCGKEVKPQVARQVVGEKGGRGQVNKDCIKKPGVKTLIRKAVQLLSHHIFNLWVYGMPTPRQYFFHTLSENLGVFRYHFYSEFFSKCDIRNKKYIYIYNLDIRWRHLHCHNALDCLIGIISKC